MPRVSVITAARDAAPYLREALDSVFAQTFGDWEAVVVDDGSTDDTPDVARSYGNRVRVIANERPLGPAGARNLGFEHARGELVATLDADDIWTPGYLESQVALYDRARSEGTRVGLVCCDARLLGPRGFEDDTFADRSARPRGKVTLTDLLRVNVVFTSVLAPREVILGLGGYDTALPVAEDYDLWIRMAEAGYEIVWNPEPLATYRLRPESLAGGTSDHLTQCTIRVYERALERGRLDRGQRRIARRQRRLHRLLGRRARVGQEGGGLLPRLALLPGTALVALEHPERWAGWIRHRGARPSLPGGGFR
jgi:cellulose synthase/poly-beta-1,6-N-acetylglucosamine synthase-like glycosyltransferase